MFIRPPAGAVSRTPCQPGAAHPKLLREGPGASSVSSEGKPLPRPTPGVHLQGSVGAECREPFSSFSKLRLAGENICVTSFLGVTTLGYSV